MDNTRFFESDMNLIEELLLSDVMKPQFLPKAEQTICADLLAKAPVLVEIVREELEKCREIARCIEDLEPKG